MRKKHFQFLLVALPMFALLAFTSCSNEADDTGDGTKTEEKESKPLIEREPQVKEYFKVLNEVINEYIKVGETALDVLEKLDQDDLNAMDAMTASVKLMESMEAIQELEESLEQQGTIKENVEKNLNAEDILKFTEMYKESMARMDSVSKRLAEIDVNSYLEDVDLF
ncbi:MAG: hypothetical protein NXI10_09680 [bacterium]|nr:hypothetical protein [bacterium]